jgi:hypothetical protein
MDWQLDLTRINGGGDYKSSATDYKSPATVVAFNIFVYLCT